jgi:hypothetical protein
MAYFTRGLAAVGARVYGLGDQPLAALKPEVRAALSDYRQVPTLWDADLVLEEVRSWLKGKPLDRAECLWEPGMEIVARIREAFDLPGLDLEHSIAFRDKEAMKQRLDAAGIRTPRHARAASERECREAAERIGYPLIIKPIAGAGSADTHHLRDDGDFDKALRLLAHVPEVSVEEYIDGEEYTFETICANGEILFHGVSWYRPKPLVMRQNAWISPISITLRDPSVPEIQVGVDLGYQVVRAMGFESGITHMEWFRTPDGEAVFGEIGGRAPGGRLVHSLNYSADIDLFTGWAEAICHGRFTQPVDRRYNVGLVFKRAEGDGRITRIEGLDHVMAHWGEHIVHVDLLPIGAPRRDYRRVAEGDGWVAVRHPDLDTTVELSDLIATHLKMYAG